LFYEGLKFKKLDWAIFDLDSTNLGRIDLCYNRKLKSTDTDPHLFLENSYQNINKKMTSAAPKLVRMVRFYGLENDRVLIFFEFI